MTGPHLGAYDPPDDSELANLARAVEIGGEGGSLTLLGPVTGRGSFYAVRGRIDTIDDEGYVTYLGADLVPLGTRLIPALKRLNPYWRHMTGMYVAPRFDAKVRTELARAGGKSYDDWRYPGDDWPMTCRRVWPACDVWVDREPRDGFWLEGNLDQARALLGRLSFEHQRQVQIAANERFCVLVSRDGTQRLGYEYSFPFSNQWSYSPFLDLPPFEVHHLNQLKDAPLPQC